jgi:malonate-semialdehyde dehydrogenase (acetylating)/methylmalonate-semialdehyde dehydrogenase
MAEELYHFIGGKRVAGTSGAFADVYWPMTGEVAAAQPAWAAVNPQRRARVMMKFLDLVHRDYDELAELLAREHGKTIPTPAAISSAASKSASSRSASRI